MQLTKTAKCPSCGSRDVKDIGYDEGSREHLLRRLSAPRPVS